MRILKALTTNVAILLILFPEFSNGIGQVAQTQSPSKDARINTYHQVLDIIFPHERDFSQKGNTLKVFSLTLRFKPAFDPESQINIDKYGDGKIEVLMYTVANKKNVHYQLPDLVNQVGREDAESLAKLIPVEKREVRKPGRVIQGLLNRYAALRFSPQLDTGLYFDPTRYDLWYEAPSNRVHFSLVGSDPGKRHYSDPIIKWMNEVLQAAR